MRRTFSSVLALVTQQAYRKPNDLSTQQHHHSSKQMRTYFDHRPAPAGLESDNREGNWKAPTNPVTHSYIAASVQMAMNGSDRRICLLRRWIGYFLMARRSAFMGESGFRAVLACGMPGPMPWLMVVPIAGWCLRCRCTAQAGCRRWC